MDVADDIDPILEDLESSARSKERGGEHLGSLESMTDEAPPDDAPVDLEPTTPLVLDLRKQLEATGGAPAEMLKSVLGAARWPLLVCHGLTPFVKAGEKPSRVCGLGYEARLDGEQGRTVGFLPESSFVDVAKLDTEIEAGIDGTGALGVPDVALSAAVSKWVTLGPIRIAAATHNRFALALHLVWTVLEAQAGPLAGGGVRWNLYQRRERLDRFQALAQVVLVPDGTQELVFATRTWVKVAGRFFGLGKDRVWKSPERTFRVSLQGS